VVHAVLIQFGDSSSGIGALGINVQAFLIQLATFVIALLLLKRFAFKPILKVLQERRSVIEKGIKLGEEMQKQEVELEKKVSEALHKARQQADEIVAQAGDQARQTIQEAEEKARGKAAGIITEAEERIAQDRSRARRQLENELVGLVAEATEAVLEEKVDTAKDAALIDKALKGVSRS